MLTKDWIFICLLQVIRNAKHWKYPKSLVKILKLWIPKYFNEKKKPNLLKTRFIFLNLIQLEFWNNLCVKQKSTFLKRLVALFFRNFSLFQVLLYYFAKLMLDLQFKPQKNQPSALSGALQVHKVCYIENKSCSAYVCYRISTQHITKNVIVIINIPSTPSMRYVTVLLIVTNCSL